MDIIRDKYKNYSPKNKSAFYSLFNEIEDRSEEFITKNINEIRSMIESVHLRLRAQYIADFALLRAYREHVKDPSGYGTRVAVIKEKILARYPEGFKTEYGITYESLSTIYPGDRDYKKEIIVDMMKRK